MEVKEAHVQQDSDGEYSEYELEAHSDAEDHRPSDMDEEDAIFMKALKAAPKEYQDLNEDAWSMGIIAIVRDLPTVLEFEMTCLRRYAATLRLVFCLFVLAGNLTIQIMALQLVQRFVVAPSVHTLQEHYKEFHASCFTPTGILQAEEWEDFPYKRQLCEAALVKPTFISLVLLLWNIRMLQEFRETNHLRRKMAKLAQLPASAHYTQMVHEIHDDGDDIHGIIALNTTTRVALWIVILIPKFCICLYLLFIGTRWLLSTESFGDLILNALALEFVIGIDEYLFEGLFPEVAHDLVSLAKFAPVFDDSFNTQEAKDHHTIKQYHRSIFSIAICCIGVWLYLGYFQQVLPGYANDLGYDCKEYYQSKFALLCKPFEENCFPYGMEWLRTQGVLVDDADHAHHTASHSSGGGGSSNSGHHSHHKR